MHGYTIDMNRTHLDNYGLTRTCGPGGVMPGGLDPSRRPPPLVLVRHHAMQTIAGSLERLGLGLAQALPFELFGEIPIEVPKDCGGQRHRGPLIRAVQHACNHDPSITPENQNGNPPCLQKEHG